MSEETYEIDTLVVGKVVSVPRKNPNGSYVSEVEIWSKSALNPPVPVVKLSWVSFIFGMLLGSMIVLFTYAF